MKRQGEWQGLSDNAAKHIGGGFDNRSGARVTGDEKSPNRMFGSEDVKTAALPPCLSRYKRFAQKPDEVAPDGGGCVEFKNQITVTDGKSAACLCRWGIL